MPALATSQPSRGDRRVDQLIQRTGQTCSALGRFGVVLPGLRRNRRNEYRKMVELSTKMTLVGHAATTTSAFAIAAASGSHRLAAVASRRQLHGRLRREAARIPGPVQCCSREWFHPRTVRDSSSMP
jgi:hypothetical protein